MDLLKTILVYMSMVFAASVQNAPDPGALPDYNAPTPTPYVQAQATQAPTATPTPRPTPVPTVNITPNPEYGTLQVGDNGDEVRRLQEALAQYGYYEGDIDGRYGNQTRRAVERFQYQHGLSSDGIAGRNTLTVLYESGEVRRMPTAATPTPAPSDGLSVAMTETPAAATAAPTQTPAAAQPPTGTPTPAPPHTAAPTQTPVAPTATPVPDFLPMEGYAIFVGAQQQPLTVQDGGEERPLVPYTLGDVRYLPLLEILRGASLNVIASQSVEMDEYAFAAGDQIIRITFTEDQAGEPAGLAAYRNNEPQILPLRDVRRADGVLYLPVSTIQSLTGFTVQEDADARAMTVTIPAAQDDDSGE